MTDFPTLSYTSAPEIPILSYAWRLKKVPLTGGASPYKPLQGEPPSSPGPSSKEKTSFYNVQHEAFLIVCGNRVVRQKQKNRSAAT